MGALGGVWEEHDDWGKRNVVKVKIGIGKLGKGGGGNREREGREREEAGKT